MLLLLLLLLLLMMMMMVMMMMMMMMMMLLCLLLRFFVIARRLHPACTGAWLERSAVVARGVRCMRPAVLTRRIVHYTHAIHQRPLVVATAAITIIMSRFAAIMIMIMMIMLRLCRCI